MNERIKELVEKSYIYDKQNDSSFFNKGKFAELIIKECAHIAWLNSTEDNISHTKIKEHFGVEE